LDIPSVFLYSFLYFTPIYDVGKVLAPPTIENNRSRTIRVTGLLDSVRPADED